jgi:hypothetical protein
MTEIAGSLVNVLVAWLDGVEDAASAAGGSGSLGEAMGTFITVRSELAAVSS